MECKFFNYSKRFGNDKEVIKDIVYQVGNSDNFILRDNVIDLENTIKEYTGAKHAIAVSNGTAALTIILKALGVGPGVDVLTPAFSFISTASTISLLGARPIFVDVNDNGVMDPVDLEKKITPNSKVVIPTHLFSVMADMDEIRKVSKRYNLFVLEDSAVYLGGKMNNVQAGLLGDIGLFSFFPAKPMGGIGDGAMIVTNNEEIGTLCRMFRNHGQDGKVRFCHQFLGYNHRMDEIVAAYINYKFKNFNKIIRDRRKIAEIYDRNLKPLFPYVKVPVHTNYEPVYYTYVVRAQNRDQLQDYLKSKNIETVIYYPLPLHLQDAFKYLEYKKGDFPNAELFCEESLALPLYPEMTNEEVEYVSQEVRKFYESSIVD